VFEPYMLEPYLVEPYMPDRDIALAPALTSPTKREASAESAPTNCPGRRLLRMKLSEE
jgi:hypothetical protein